MTSTSADTPRLFGYTGQWTTPVDEQVLTEYANGITAVSVDGGSTPGQRSATRIGGPSCSAADGVIVALEGDPIADFATDSKIGGNIAASIGAAWRRQGIRFLEHLHGGFALSLLDLRSGAVLLAVDRMGIERVSYAVAGRAIVFSSSVHAVAHFPALSSRFRLQAIFDYLLLHMVPSPDSAYEQVLKLRPGTYALFSDGKLAVTRYWRPVFTERGRADPAALSEQIQSGLQAGVKDCRPDQHSGAFLSGGLDSSSVSGMLCKVLERPAPTFSIGFGVDSYNELEFAGIASRRFGSIAHEYAVTADDIVSTFGQIAAAYDEPFGNSSAVPTLFCARLARSHGVTHLLAGDGGDEIFGGNERYARQRVFEYYGAAPQWLRSGFIEPMSRWFDAENSALPFRKFRSYVDQARIPMPERLETWNFIYRANLDEMLHPAFRSGIDPRAPFRRMQEVYADSQCESLVNRMLYYDWQYTLADNDLRKVGTMCRLAGVRVSYPMLHPQLIDVSLRIPPELKVRGDHLRVLYKQAMRNFLPTEIINKSKHGFGLPFGQWLKTHTALGDLIYSHLNDLKKRHIIRAAFLDKLISDHRDGHPSFFGYAIWDLAMLEAWLQTHRVNI